MSILILLILGTARIYLLYIYFIYFYNILDVFFGKRLI